MHHLSPGGYHRQDWHVIHASTHCRTFSAVPPAPRTSLGTSLISVSMHPASSPSPSLSTCIATEIKSKYLTDNRSMPFLRVCRLR
jgi:hypothetical protein